MVKQALEKAVPCLCIFTLRNRIVGRTGIECLKHGTVFVIAGIPVDGVLVPEHVSLVHSFPYGQKLLQICFASLYSVVRVNLV